MQPITPYLTINGAEKALDFYQKAFGATDLFRHPAEEVSWSFRGASEASEPEIHGHSCRDLAPPARYGNSQGDGFRPSQCSAGMTGENYSAAFVSATSPAPLSCFSVMRAFLPRRPRR